MPEFIHHTCFALADCVMESQHPFLDDAGNLEPTTNNQKHLESNEYKEEWAKLWDEHYTSVYNYYYNAFHQQSSLTFEEDNPIPQYDLSEHLSLLNTNDYYEAIVTIPEDAVKTEETPCNSSMDLTVEATESAALDLNRYL